MRSSARPTRRHARSNWSSTVSLYVPSAFFSTRAFSGAVAAARDGHPRRGLGGAELHHEPRQHFRLDFGRRRHHRPDERRRRHGRSCVVGTCSIARAEMKTSTVPGSTPRSMRVRNLSRLYVSAEDIGDLADRALQEVLRGVDAVLRPVGFHDAGRGLVDGDHEAVLLPEGPDGVPRLLRRGLDDQPALAAGADDLGIRRRSAGDRRGRPCWRSPRRGPTRS